MDCECPFCPNSTPHFPRVCSWMMLQPCTMPRAAVAVRSANCYFESIRNWTFRPSNMVHRGPFKGLLHTVGERNPANQWRLIVHPIIYKVLCIQKVVGWDFWTINSSNLWKPRWHIVFHTFCESWWGILFHRCHKEDQHGHTPLLWAVRHGMAGAMQLLLRRMQV